MKVIEKREYSFDNEDLKLLKETLPGNPCEKCSPSERMVCCGCPDRREYDKVIEVYKDHNIYEIACAIHTVDALVDEETRLKTQIKAVKHDIALAMSSIPDEICAGLNYETPCHRDLHVTTNHDVDINIPAKLKL